jgi:hypothetical protein
MIDQTENVSHEFIDDHGLQGPGRTLRGSSKNSGSEKIMDLDLLDDLFDNFPGKYKGKFKICLDGKTYYISRKNAGFINVDLINSDEIRIETVGLKWVNPKTIITTFSVEELKSCFKEKRHTVILENNIVESRVIFEKRINDCYGLITTHLVYKIIFHNGTMHTIEVKKNHTICCTDYTRITNINRYVAKPEDEDDG